MKEERKKRKQYKKDFKKAKKAFIKIIKKDYGPWDNFLGEFFLVIVDHWKKYYSLGYNVMAMEVRDEPTLNDPDHPTRYEIACELERRYKAWKDFTSVAEIVPADNDLGYEVIYKKGFCDAESAACNIRLVNEEENRLKQDFYSYYIKYIEEMWD